MYIIKAIKEKRYRKYKKLLTPKYIFGFIKAAWFPMCLTLLVIITLITAMMAIFPISKLSATLLVVIVIQETIVRDMAAWIEYDMKSMGLWVGGDEE